MGNSLLRKRPLVQKIEYAVCDATNFIMSDGDEEDNTGGQYNGIKE